MTNEILKKDGWVRASSRSTHIGSASIRIGKAGMITLGSRCVIENNLDKCKEVIVWRNEKDPYKFGLEFLLEKREGSYKLVKNHHCTTMTRTFNAKSVINSNKVLKDISKKKEDIQRTFQLERKSENFFEFITRPGFENSKISAQITDIPAHLSGIYRCKNDLGETKYIGSGRIRKEALSALSKSNNSFTVIEYSEIENRDKAYDWERYFQQRHVDEFGELPEFNKVFAPDKNTGINSFDLNLGEAL
jgi:hypothetical protein